MALCGNFQILEITDGTTTINLLNAYSGFFVTDWTPSIASLKDDGVWSNSPLVDGRKLRMRKRDNVIENFEVQVRGFEPDMLIRETQELRRLLEKAANYSVSAWSPGAVWIKAQGLRETNPRYALIENYGAQADNCPYSNQDYFWNKLGQAAFEDWQLVIEREPFWRSVPPGQPCPDARSESITWAESGCDPSYLTFDGADSLVNCGSDASLDDIPDNAVAGRGKITAEALIRANSLGEANAGVVFRKLSVFMRMDVAGLYAEVRCAAQNAISTSGTDEFTPDSLWHHVCMVYDETGADTPAARTIYLAVDGVWVVSYPTQQVSIGNYVTDAASDLIIGNNSGATTTFDGDIGWVRISDIIRYDPAGGNFTPEPRCTPPDPSTGTQLLLRHSPGYGVQTDDYSGHGNDGALTATLWGCNCFYDNTVYPCWPNYLEFNGETSLVNCGSDVTLDDIPDNAVAGRGQLTAQTWIRSRGTGEGALGRIFEKGSWRLMVSAAGLQSEIVCAAQTAISSSGTDEFDPTDYVWHHVLMTYDERAVPDLPASRTIYLAVDGVWVASYPTQQVSIGNYTTDAAQSLIIGNTVAANRTFDGDIGWAKVSDVILYDPADGNFTPEPRCALPTIDADVMLQVIYDGTGATTYDRSGNDNDGAITEAVWDCDCTYTDEDGVECNCVQASGSQSDWEYEAWAIQDALPVGFVSKILETSAHTLVACETSSNVWLSVAGLAPWVAATTPPAPLVSCYAMLEATDGNIYLIGQDTGTGRVECWRSADYGDNWVQRTNDICGAASNATTNCITEFDGYLYVATTIGIYRSNDGGTTWVQVLSDVTYSMIATDDYVFCTGLYGGIAGSTLTGCYRSSDGAVWDFGEIAEGGGSIEFITTLDDDYLYTGDDNSVFRSPITDGLSWETLVTITGANQFIDIIIKDGLYYALKSGAPNGRLYVGPSIQELTLRVTFGGITSTLCEYSRNERIYVGENGDIWISPDFTDVAGREETCLDEVFIANKRNIAQLTTIFVYDASTTTYVSQFPAAALPFFLLPSPFAIGDIVYFCIDSSVLDSGPFCSLILDLLQGTVVVDATTMIWEYSQGAAAWATLNVSDETMLGAGHSLERRGVNGIYWIPPSDWATDTVNGVTGLWVRLRVHALNAWIQSPIQQHRDIYTVNWPDAVIDAAQVAGDVPALLRIEAHNRSDEDGYSTVDELDLLDNRLIVGLRSTDRGENFVSFINLAADGIVADTYSQNNIGITVTDGTGTVTVADIRAPAGIACRHTTPPTGSVLTYADAAMVTFGPSIARDFYGTFHVFLRAQLEEPAAAPNGGPGDSQRLRLTYKTGSGGISETSNYKVFNGADANTEHYKDYQLIDFGRVTLPVSGAFMPDELPDEFSIVVQISSAAAVNMQITLYDLVLIPADEWSGDFVDSAFEDDSCVSNGFELDIDSVTFPRQSLRALTRTTDTGAFIKSIYERIGIGPAILQANADQKLHFLSARGAIQGWHVGPANSAFLQDTYSDFVNAGVQAGMTVYNLTDGSQATITFVTTNTIQGTLAGGAENDWDIGDVYLIVCGNWRSDPQAVHSVKLEHVARYLSMRGNR